jgi:hypothetical protein
MQFRLPQPATLPAALRQLTRRHSYSYAGFAPGAQAADEEIFRAIRM